jgi:hypothetical protein
MPLAFGLATAAQAAGKSDTAPELSVAQLFQSHIRFDKAPVVVHGELRQYVEGELLLDEHCQGACLNVIGFNVPQAIANRADVRSLFNARVDNEHRCFVRLKVMVTYKFARSDQPPPPAGLRVSKLEIVEVLGLSTRPVGGGFSDKRRPCGTLGA